ncbi:MAG: molecular chaperone Hsp90 [Anaerovoracaceae bacterium]|jgi:hypothetical protein
MTKDEVIAKAKELLEAPSICPELKEETEAWLKAVGTDGEKDETKRFIAELEDDIVPIDDSIAFFGSPDAEKIFGKEQAAATLAHMKEVKANGGKYCDCPACSAAKAILDSKDAIL